MGDSDCGEETRFCCSVDARYAQTRIADTRVC